jgi:hypothetical protein
MRLHAIYAHKCATSTQRIPQTPYQATEFVVTMPARSRSSSYSRCAIPCTMRVAGSVCASGHCVVVCSTGAPLRYTERR